MIEPSRRRRRDPALVWTLLGATLLVVLLVGVAIARRDASTRVARRPTKSGSGARSTPTGAPPRDRAGSSRAPIMGAHPDRLDPSRAKLQAALEHGVSSADELGGEAAAAVWISGDPQPLASGPVQRHNRMWSMSKAVVSLAALQAVRDRPDPVLSSTLADAIRRSDNCAIRRVIVGLQDGLKRGVAGTVEAFEGVLARAGARIETAPQAAAAEQACVRYLDSHSADLPGGDLGVAPQFGTAQWSMLDAIAFTHALSEGVYGATGAYLLGLMAKPKQSPIEEPAPPSAPSLDWGAGAVFPSAWHPAWKAGWGGSRERPARFLAGQIVVLHLARTPVAVAAVFLPSVQPSLDNPGLTASPQALERIFAAVRSGLQSEHVGR